MRGFFEARPRLAAVIALATALVGIYAARFVAVSDYPELAPTIVEVSTTYSGASPSVIADTVATPIEDQINSVENVYFFDSRCSDSGTYELYVTFLPGTDPDMNLVKVQNAVKRAEPKLPPSAYFSSPGRSAGGFPSPTCARTSNVVSSP